MNADVVCFVEYIWIGGNNELRSKTKVMYSPVSNIVIYLRGIMTVVPQTRHSATTPRLS